MTITAMTCFVLCVDWDHEDDSRIFSGAVRVVIRGNSWHLRVKYSGCSLEKKSKRLEKLPPIFSVPESDIQCRNVYQVGWKIQNLDGKFFTVKVWIYPKRRIAKELESGKKKVKWHSHQLRGYPFIFQAWVMSLHETSSVEIFSDG